VQVHRQSKLLAVIGEVHHEQDLEEIMAELEETVHKRTWWRRWGGGARRGGGVALCAYNRVLLGVWGCNPLLTAAVYHERTMQC
jgi:hypothetical protein